MMELFERVFTFFLGVSGSYGLTILMMSFVVSLILAPFYHITGILEKREKEIRLKLQPYISKINKIKNTKIRHEHITNLYKAYNYLPIKSLRSLSSLIIQIPIFIVVYRVLNRLLANNPYTADASFWFINHLSNQDNLLYGINLLPILMTLINITSVILMTNFSKDRKQGYATAVFFMIFLYRSPAGLVLFWASNNFLNLIRYLYVYLKKTNFKNISYKLKFYSLSLSKKEYVRTYLFLISIYFLINTILTSSNVNSPTIVFLPFYLLFLLRIYDYLRVYKKLIVKPDTNNDRKTYLYLILLLTVLLFIIAIFVANKLKIYLLFGILTLILIYNAPNIKNNVIKKILKSLVLPVSAILFPAVLYEKTNAIYFENYDTVIYFITLIISSMLIPIVVYMFNSRLTVASIIKYSTSFIVSVMFLPLIREIINYTGKAPIDFILIFSITLLIINLLEKQKKVMAIFFLCASFYIFFVNIGVEDVRGHSIIPTKNILTIPEELKDMKIKDTASVYLFMQDAFPHRDLMKELNLDQKDLNHLLKKYEFKEYNVYSIGSRTLLTMASTFDMMDLSEKLNPLLRNIVSGNSITSKIFALNGYYNFIATGNNNYVFDSDARAAFSEYKGIDSKQDVWYVIHGIVRGTLNTIVLDNYELIDMPTLDLAKFASNNKNKDKIFAWALGYPGHSSRSYKGFRYEFEYWLPKYYKSIEDLKIELELTINNNPDAIIVIMSDHGPYLFVNTDREIYNRRNDSILIRDMYGAFMAIRWPDKGRAEKYDKEFFITQDLFPIVFSYLYDSPVPLKYKIKDTAVRIKDHKFDKGVFYPHFYKKKEE